MKEQKYEWKQEQEEEGKRSLDKNVKVKHNGNGGKRNEGRRECKRKPGQEREPELGKGL